MILHAPESENRFVIDTDWDGYLRFLDAVGERRVRVTFDGECVEIMTVSHRHERSKSVLRMLLECLMEELGTDFEPGGNLTIKRELLQRGLEPDECYWIANYESVLEGWDPATGPPPDLALEVEVTRSRLDRIGIYARLRVPELWRLDRDGTVEVLVLQDQDYTPSPGSLSFPSLPLAELNRFLAMAQTTPASKVVRQFRAWVRATLA